MRDYDREEILMHYGTPGQKRPTGLKYKTRKISNSLYQHRQEQMHGSTNEKSETEEKQSREWNKKKYVADTKTKVDPMDPVASRKSDSPPSNVNKKSFASEKRGKIDKAKKEADMNRARLDAWFKNQQNMFKKKQKSEHEKDLEKTRKQEKTVKDNLKNNSSTRYGLKYVGSPIYSKLGKSGSQYKKYKQVIRNQHELRNRLFHD